MRPHDLTPLEGRVHRQWGAIGRGNERQQLLLGETACLTRGDHCPTARPCFYLPVVGAVGVGVRGLDDGGCVTVVVSADTVVGPAETGAGTDDQTVVIRRDHARPSEGRVRSDRCPMCRNIQLGDGITWGRRRGQGELAPVVVSYVPVGIHPAHPPIVGVEGQGIHRGDPEVVGGVGFVHRREGIGCTQFDLVVCRPVNCLPFKSRYGDASVIIGTDQHGAVGAFGEGPARAGRAHVPVCVHSAHSPVVRAMSERIDGSNASVVGGVGEVHRREGIGCTQFDLVVCRPVNCLPFKSRYGDASVIIGTDQHGAVGAFGEGPARAGRAHVPVCVHSAHSPVVRAMSERIDGSNASVVGGVGEVHRHKSGNGAQFNLVVGRPVNGLPLEGRYDNAGTAIRRTDQVRGGDGFGEVDLAAPSSGDIRAVYRSHPPVERCVSEIGCVVGSQGEVDCLGAPQDGVGVALKTNLHLVFRCASGSLPGKGGSHNGRALSRADRYRGLRLSGDGLRIEYRESDENYKHNQ